MVESKIDKSEIEKILTEVKYRLKKHNGFGEIVIKLNNGKGVQVVPKECYKIK